MSDHLQPRLLVTGANGHLGREIVTALLESGATNVRAASRHPESLGDLAAKGAETTHLDFDDAASLASAFAGVDRVVIVSTDAVMVPGQRLRQHRAAVEAAAKAGVGRIIYTSMPKPEPGSPVPFAPDHYETEQAIERSGIPFTILRVNWYDENAFMWLPAVLAPGRWVTSMGTGRGGYVARKDVARTVAAALRAPKAFGRLDVTGPQGLSADEILPILNQVLSTALVLKQVSDVEREEGLISAGLPAQWAKLIVAMEANTRAGGIDIVTIVETLTATRPQTFSDFLIENREAFLNAAKALSVPSHSHAK
jgi:NAD(P)H dehydrogenase (quinone)